MEDNQGGKYSLSFQGPLSQERLSKLNHFISILNSNNEQEEPLPDSNTTFGKLCRLIEEKFSFGSFTSNDIQESYEDQYTQPIKLTTIATYLARLNDRNQLNRERIGSGWNYRKVRPEAINA